MSNLLEILLSVGGTYSAIKLSNYIKFYKKKSPKEPDSIKWSGQCFTLADSREIVYGFKCMKCAHFVTLEEAKNEIRKYCECHEFPRGHFHFECFVSFPISKVNIDSNRKLKTKQPGAPGCGFKTIMRSEDEK